MIEFTDADLFPDCTMENCEQRGEGKHQHILPHQQEILDWVTGGVLGTSLVDRNNLPESFVEIQKSYLYTQGGVGSAKTIAFAAAIVKLTLMIPCNRGVVGRKDFKLLYKSSWRDIKSCLRRLVDRHIILPPIYSDKRHGDYTNIRIQENDSEIYALQTKNWGEGLGAGYGWFWIDDAMESQEELFVGDETNAGLISRLRNFVRDYTHDVPLRFRGLASSNPPPIGHWLHKLFGKTEGLHKLGNDPVRVMIVETFLNPFVGEGYAEGLMAIQKKMGRDSNTARRVIFGESQPAYGGVKVFPEFVHERHVGKWDVDKTLPVIAGWDFGFLHPAIVFNQMWKCSFGYNHFRAMSEIANMFNCNVWDLHKAAKEHWEEMYQGCSIYHGGDRSGYRSSSNNKDKRGDMKILIDEMGMVFKHRVLDLKNSLTYMRGLLKTCCKCGEEIVQIDKSCEVLIGALEGGYKYPKNRQGVIGEKPYEDRYFADVACAWRYGAENYCKWGIPYVYGADRVAKVKRAPKPWEWMELSPEEMADVLTNSN